MQGTVPAIRPGWRAANAHDTAARATIRQARWAGRAGARRAAGARAHMRHGSWAARAQARGALERAGARQQAGREDARACRGALAVLRHGSLALRHDRGARPRHGQAAHNTATSAQPVRAGWASWASFGARAPGLVFYLVFDSIFVLSHQMNTVHCKINFEKKIILNLIKIKSNQIKFDKIFEK